MRKLTVKELGKEVYVQAHKDEYLDHYAQYAEYFESLLNSIGKIIPDCNLVLEAGKNTTLLVLYLEEEQKKFAQKISDQLMKDFPDDIKRIVIQGNKLNIRDIFYESNLQVKG